MTGKKRNILSKKNKIEKDKLKEYLKDNLSEELLHAIDNDSDDEFLKDAMEGLESFSSAKKIRENVHQLNQKLHQSTHEKRKPNPFEFSQNTWYIIAVIIILLLILLGYTVLSMKH